MHGLKQRPICARTTGLTAAAAAGCCYMVKIFIRYIHQHHYSCIFSDSIISTNNTTYSSITSSRIALLVVACVKRQITFIQSYI